MTPVFGVNMFSLNHIFKYPLNPEKLLIYRWYKNVTPRFNVTSLIAIEFRRDETNLNGFDSRIMVTGFVEVRGIAGYSIFCAGGKHKTLSVSLTSRTVRTWPNLYIEQSVTFALQLHRVPLSKEEVSRSNVFDKYDIYQK